MITSVRITYLLCKLSVSFVYTKRNVLLHLISCLNRLFVICRCLIRSSYFLSRPFEIIRFHLYAIDNTITLELLIDSYISTLNLPIIRPSHNVATYRIICFLIVLVLQELLQLCNSLVYHLQLQLLLQ